MAKNFIKWSTASALLLSAASITPTIASAEQTPENNFSLTVLHSNDTHAHVANAPERAALVKN